MLSIYALNLGQGKLWNGHLRRVISYEASLIERGSKLTMAILGQQRLAVEAVTQAARSNAAATLATGFAGSCRSAVRTDDIHCSAAASAFLRAFRASS
jgi:hypothetical protein